MKFKRLDWILSKYLSSYFFQKPPEVGVLGYVFGVQSYLLTFGVWKPHFLDIPKQIKKTKTFFLSEFLEGILSQDLQIIFSRGHLDV